MMKDLAQAEIWTRQRTTGPGVFNFAVELKEDNSETPRILGVVGTFGLPMVGYMICPDDAGKGYATEAFSAMILQLFERLPPASQGGFDHVEGWTDIENWPSRRILEKCGFTLCERRPDPDNLLRGPSELLIYRKARDGKTLEELGLSWANVTEESRPTPPVQ